MQKDIIMAGFGGQGILLIGKLLSYAALEEGRETCWIPSYGPEMRGGTANCTVVVSDRPIGSPIIYSPHAAIVMNRPSLDKFGPMVKPGGLLLINSALIDVNSPRTDISIHRIAANTIAIEMGNGRAANMVMLGAYVGLTELVKLDTIIAMLKMTFAKKPAVLDLNIKVVRKGYEIGRAGAQKEVKA